MAKDAPSSGPGIVDIFNVLSDIQRDAIRFRRIQMPTGTTRFDEFLHRLHRLDVVVFYPFLLALLGRDATDAVDLDEIAKALESYLIRRMVCNLQTRGYGMFALELLDVLAKVPNGERAAPTIIKRLTDESQSALQWPNDEAFRLGWTTRRFYGSLRKDRVLMMLQAIELQLQQQSTKTEPVLKFDFDKLTIEHILPQGWHTHWPLTDGVAAHERDLFVHGIGNLTLVSKTLNPSMSNAPWLATANSKNSKRAALGDHSNLLLNARLVKGYPDRWDEQGIQRRALELFDVAKTVWPMPLSADANRVA